MDYKQKYEEALERAKRYQGMVVLPAESMIETIFPELAESQDEKTRKEIVGYLKKNLRLEWATWLEKQGQKPTWSEEDEVRLQACIDTLQAKSIMGNVWYAEHWLKSLKQRHTWKPSEEQLKFLQHYADQNNYAGTILTSLLNDLKKL